MRGRKYLSICHHEYKVSTPKCDTCFGLVNWGVVETKKFMSWLASIRGIEWNWFCNFWRLYEYPPLVDTRLVLNWTPSSTTCSTSHWLPQSAPQLPLVTFETLCWNRKHVLSNLGSLSGVHSHFYRCPKKVAVTFGCTHLTRDVWLWSGKSPPMSQQYWEELKPLLAGAQLD
jgi:hypothetical protein